MKEWLGENPQLTIKETFGSTNETVTSLTYDSRNVHKNTAFFCITGAEEDGHAYIQAAIQRGACLIVGTNRDVLHKESMYQKKGVAFLVVDDARTALAAAASLNYQEKTKHVTLIGVTGTNGKTTTTSYIRSILNQGGLETGMIGTTGFWGPSTKIGRSSTTPTTPEITDIYSIIEAIMEQKGRAVAMEVTSIALDQKRVEGLPFEIGVHTNVTPEHLDYHGTFEHYKQTKQRLFHQTKKAILNMDDPSGFAADVMNTFSGPILTYSIEKEADIAASAITVSEVGTSFYVHVNKKTYFVKAPIYGRYNVSNLLAAIGVGLHIGMDIEKILSAMHTVSSVEGRFQFIRIPEAPTIILDYAHTPEALTNLLKEVQPLKQKRLIVMITGVGIRDPQKRPRMAQAVEGRAEEVVVSVDHPGYENPTTIVQGVIAGFSSTRQESHIHQTFTREEGVLAALSLAHQEDLVVITGGNINGAQHVKGKAFPHSDEKIIDQYYKRNKNERDPK